ncbi:transcriptional regulator, XRE family [Segniliparus rotundus DSM 44985]|uniref:Transcriptional regulator, XRE family n=1 Tax=Segniliparus rotundus (strain ATCC BAA-972 / CDC 1076 / CIP 108378 / DSM 44985 / JCM 13578) TaxID=640132 RepID=D6ZE81_SEGRD|nr:transcriptional regulator, XRE family [Segniliparus rotundus DSM 44985]
MARNLVRYRKQAELSQVDVVRMLTERGVPLSVPSYSAIENGGTRITVDLLVAAADALGVSPATLLIPHAEDMEAEVELTGAKATAVQAWRWITAQSPLKPLEDKGKRAEAEVRAWRYRVSPIWWGRGQDGDR